MKVQIVETIDRGRKIEKEKARGTKLASQSIATAAAAAAAVGRI